MLLTIILLVLNHLFFIQLQIRTIAEIKYALRILLETQFKHSFTFHFVSVKLILTIATTFCFSPVSHTILPLKDLIIKFAITTQVSLGVKHTEMPHCRHPQIKVRALLRIEQKPSLMRKSD